MKELSNSEFEKFRDFIKKNLGIKMGPEKKALIFTRLKATVQNYGFKDFTEYYNFLVNETSGKALTEFTSIITTNHTYFMRESDHFDHFRDNVLPYLYDKHSDTKSLKIWCAASSTGEESYTLQFLIQDFFDAREKKFWDLKILATDISNKVLDKAVLGVYSNESISMLPKSWQSKYFNPYNDKHSIVKDDIKKEVIFRKFNLIETNYPLKKDIQVIFCRNVIIYFDNDTKDFIINKFYDLLEPGGYLFIGHSEILSPNNKFDYVIPSVYRKKFI